MTSTENTGASEGNVTDLAAERQARTQAKKDNANKNRRFDTEKVARLKAAIEDGSYKIDPARIATKFIESDHS